MKKIFFYIIFCSSFMALNAQKDDSAVSNVHNEFEIFEVFIKGVIENPHNKNLQKHAFPECIKRICGKNINVIKKKKFLSLLTKYSYNPNIAEIIETIHRICPDTLSALSLMPLQKTEL
jgi:hypothetical protein